MTRIRKSLYGCGLVALLCITLSGCSKDSSSPVTAPNSTGNTPNPNPGPGVTDQNGNSYTTIILNNGQEWMAENLRTTTYANGDPIPNVTDNTAWTQLTTGAWAHYENNASYENYGKLYNWYAVADPRNVCPAGWHVPTDADWNTLVGYLDPAYDPGAEGSQSATAGGKMKSTGTQYWNAPNTGATNESGFSGLPGGYRYDANGDFSNLGNVGYWWSASEVFAEYAWYRPLINNSADVIRTDGNKRNGFSVRCLNSGNPATLSTLPVGNITASSAVSGGNITDGGGTPVTQRGVCWSTSPNPTTANNTTSNGSGVGNYASTLTGLTAGATCYVRAYAINSAGTAYGNQVQFTAGGIVSNPGAGVTFGGYTYATVVLGNGQEWMAENLRTTTYANGDPIPNVTDNTAWTQLTTGAWAHYENNGSYENPRGKLYNWYAVADPRNVCPAGWHVPTDAEWNTLVGYLDPNNGNNGEYSATAGGKMKSTGTQYWYDPNTGASNESGFSGLPGGYRSNVDGYFNNAIFTGDWWSASESGAERAWARRLAHVSVGINRFNNFKRDGLTVRCLRD
jgi:uncharacterized protein (TIGR02145 family)